MLKILKHFCGITLVSRDDHKRDLASRLKDDRKVAQTTGQSTGMEGISVGCHELKLNEIDNT